MLRPSENKFEALCLEQQETITKQSELITRLLSEIAQYRAVTREELQYLEGDPPDSWDSISK